MGTIWPKSSPFIDEETDVEKSSTTKGCQEVVGDGDGRSWQNWAPEEQGWECVTSAFDGSIM